MDRKIILSSGIPEIAVQKLEQLLNNIPQPSEDELHRLIEKYPTLLPIGPVAELISRPVLHGPKGDKFQPDILVRIEGSRYFDLIELKRSDLKAVEIFSDAEGGAPSKQPIYHKNIQRALTQIKEYDRVLQDSTVAQELQNILEAKVYFPRKFLICGTTTAFPNEIVRRKLAASHPEVTFLTWDEILAFGKEHMRILVPIVLPISPNLTGIAFTSRTSEASIHVSGLITGSGDSLIGINSLSAAIQLLAPEAEERLFERGKTLSEIAQDVSNKIDIRIGRLNHNADKETVFHDILNKVRNFHKLYPSRVTFEKAVMTLENLQEVTVFWDSYGLDTILTAKFKDETPEEGALSLTRGMLKSNYGYGFVEWVELRNELIAADAFGHLKPVERRKLL